MALYLNGNKLQYGAGGGHNYSTQEQAVGTWIDGSTLYEKTVTNISLSHNSWTTIFDAGTIGATVIEYQGVISLDGTTPYCQLEYYRNSGEFSCTSINNNQLKLLANIQAPETLLWATIRYTKTTSNTRNLNLSKGVEETELAEETEEQEEQER